ncbi:MAG TPA: permease-like cell division protein FtsX [Tissierellales bacterium]|nr:permease-like cell division protein FtsX [Tissierellales bacterium]
MRFRIFKNMMKQGFQGLWRNRGMGLASVGSITAVLLVLGMILILILSINNVALEVKHKFDEIQIFLDLDIDEAQRESIEEEIKNCEGVVSIDYQTKDDAMAILEKDLGEDLLEGIEENPLPESFIVKLEDVENADGVVKSVEDLEGVDEVKYYKDIISKLITSTNYIRTGGIIVVGVLLFISVFIISNTIKITVTARKEEINIMKYVGATNGYIRGPFIVEGLLLGLLGSVLSIFVVNYGYKYFFTRISEKLYLFFTIYLIPPYALTNDIIIIFTAIGVGIGVLGSLVSLKRFLNV